MKSVVSRIVTLSAVLFCVALAAAQEKPAVPASTDPRVGLKGGLKNAEVAARNMELVTSLPKPPGFFDPAAPAGTETEPETPAANPPTGTTEKPASTNPSDQPANASRRASSLNFANSDLAFKGNQLFIGNFSGFNIYDISNPEKAKLIASVVCPVGQGDLSIRGNLLIMSVEQTRGRIDCGTEGVEAPVSNERFRGVRIFDIKDVKKPVQVAAVQTCR